MTGRSYISFNVTAPGSTELNSLLDGSNGALFHADTSQNQFKLNISPDNEWLKFTIPALPGYCISVSLCYDSFTSADLNVHIASQGSVTEPVLGVWNATTRLFGAESLRAQLGDGAFTNGTHVAEPCADSLCRGR
ncbi:hypothetical protein F4808DRAFT_299543 [Astrocystis sublimbata]|nr:hypothetical protein F4808DRAFT_299543 [Astrocystis sublimbata]